MRTLKELLIILRVNEPLFSTGLCCLITKLRIIKKITIEEQDELFKFVNNNRPCWYSIHYSIDNRKSEYFWEEGSWAPRKKWLNSQIRKQKR